jgi:hypothetical protein
MKYIFISLFLSILTYNGFSQIFQNVVGNDYNVGLNPVDEFPLFNKEEIIKRRFTTAYVIYRGPCLDNDSPVSYKDTLTIYHFNADGEIADKTQWDWGKNFGTTIFNDNQGNFCKVNIRRKEDNTIKIDTFCYSNKSDSAVRYKILRQKKETDSIITTMAFEKFKDGFDTSMVFIKRYNAAGWLMEEEDYITKKYASLINCTTDSFHHFIYDYDEKKRLTYFSSQPSNLYTKITYYPYGKLTETINKTTGLVIQRDLRMVDETATKITITNSESQITLVRLDKESKLYRLKAITSFNNVSDIPSIEYYEIVYK